MIGPPNCAVQCRVIGQGQPAGEPSKPAAGKPDTQSRGLTWKSTRRIRLPRKQIGGKAQAQTGAIAWSTAVRAWTVASRRMRSLGTPAPSAEQTTAATRVWSVAVARAADAPTTDAPQRKAK